MTACLRARLHLRLCVQLGAGLLLFSSAARYTYAQTAQPDAAEITRTLQDASRALQGRNAARFLSYFDRKRFSDYPEIESSVAALVQQADIASSIEVGGWKQEDGEHIGTVDWILQLTLISAPGEVQTRRERIELRIAKPKTRWKIVELTPVSFFRPL